MDTSGETPLSRRWPWKPLLAGLIVTVVLVVALRWGSRRQSAPHGTQNKAYAAKIWLHASDALRANTMMAGSVTYIDGEVQNRGALPISYLTARVRFVDPFGQLAQLAVRPIVDQDSGVLKPGEIRKFRLSFSHISALWNQAPPEMKPLKIYVLAPARH